LDKPIDYELAKLELDKSRKKVSQLKEAELDEIYGELDRMGIKV